VHALKRGAGPVEASAVVGGLAIVGSWDGRLARSTQRPAALRWSFGRADDQEGAALAGRNAIVGSYDGSIYCLDTGVPAHCAGRPRVGERFYETPPGGRWAASSRHNDGCVRAFDTHSGAELWSRRRIGSFAYSAAAGETPCYVGSYDHRTLRTRRGQRRHPWTHRAPGPVVGGADVPPAVSVYFSSCGLLELRAEPAKRTTDRSQATQ